jgi:hypothetical protein
MVVSVEVRNEGSQDFTAAHQLSTDSHLFTTEYKYSIQARQNGNIKGSVGLLFLYNYALSMSRSTGRIEAVH